MVNLHQTGIAQGSLLCCSNESIDAETRRVIQDSRALSTARESPILETDYLLVLSQNCDLANPKDNNIELISIRSRSQSRTSDQLLRSRNYQKLQIQINGVTWELEAKKISIVPKQLILDQRPDISLLLEERAMQLIVDWRVGRYARVPFPDKFNRIFSGYLRSSENDLSGFLEARREKIHDLYIRVIPMDDEDASCYDVTIVALIDLHCTLEEEHEIEETLKEHWGRLHAEDNDLYFSQVEYKELGADIDITQLVVARPHDFTMFDSWHFRRFNLDYLCYD